MDKSATTKIIFAVLAFFLLVTVISQFFVHPDHALKTEIALLYKSTDAIVFDGVFIRNETVLRQQVSGVVQYVSSDGAKLAKNSVIAKVYSSASDIDICRKIDALNRRVETLEDAQSLAGTDNSQIEAFNKLIAEKHSELVGIIEDGDYSSIPAVKYQMLNLQSKRDMAKGKITDYTSVIDSLKSQILKLEDRISAQPESIVAGTSGYFVSTIDGYEDRLNFEMANSLTPETIEGIISKPSENENQSDIFGKVIDSYECKVAAVFKSDDTSAITQDSYVNIAAGAQVQPIKAYVERLERFGDKTVVIFSVEVMTSQLAALRTERFRLLVEDYSGIRINSSAIHFDEENNIGVFVKSGSKAEFRKIENIYSGDGFVIAADTTGKSGYLHMYDSIIVEGKDLYDGKIL